MLAALRQRDFSLVWFGGVLSVVGDFFLFIALLFFVYERLGPGHRGHVRRRDPAPLALRFSGGRVRGPLGSQEDDDRRRPVAGGNTVAAPGSGGGRPGVAGLRRGVCGGYRLHVLLAGQRRAHPEPGGRAAPDGGQLPELHGRADPLPGRPASGRPRRARLARHPFLSCLRCPDLSNLRTLGRRGRGTGRRRNRDRPTHRLGLGRRVARVAGGLEAGRERPPCGGRVRGGRRGHGWRGRDQRPDHRLRQGRSGGRLPGVQLDHHGLRGGGIAGGFLAAWLGPTVGETRLLALSAAANGIFLLLMFNIPALPLVVAHGVPAGATVVGWFVGAQTLLQKWVPDSHRGRVFGAYETTQALLLLVGMGLAAALAVRPGLLHRGARQPQPPDGVRWVLHTQRLA